MNCYRVASLLLVIFTLDNDINDINEYNLIFHLSHYKGRLPVIKTDLIKSVL